MKVLSIYCHCGITGFESPAVNYKELGLSLDELLIQNPNASFIGLAQGDSMKGVGIFSNDLLIVDRVKPINDGVILVANLNGEFVCKIFDKKNNRLLSASADQKPVYLTADDVFQVEGVVSVSIRRHDDSIKHLGF